MVTNIILNTVPRKVLCVMKNTILNLIVIIVVLGGCSADIEYNQEIISHEGEQILVGKTNLEGFSKEPHSIWFNENYKNYTVDQASLEGIDLSDIDIQLFLGTWCSDSQLQVPQFYKILTSLNFDKGRLEMISVDNHPDRDLQSPQHEEEGLNIEFVPTMIFYRDGVEVGRIIEFPKETLEKDMARIVGSGS